MIDLIPRVKKLLESTGITVKYGTEFHFNTVPVITFRKVTTDEGFHADNTEQSQVSKFAVDIWSNSPVQLSNIGVKVNEIMQSDGWTRTYDYDVPRQSLTSYIISRRDTKKRYILRCHNGNQY